MLELPESRVLAQQLNETISGKKIKSVTAGHTPHKLVWYYGDKEKYSQILDGKTIENVTASGSMVEIKAAGSVILIGEGMIVRFHGPDVPRPQKHQLIIEFEDLSAISANVQMYGGLGCFPEGGLDNPYYKVAKEKPSPFSAEFDLGYFSRMVSAPEVQKLSFQPTAMI